MENHGTPILAGSDPMGNPHRGRSPSAVPWIGTSGWAYPEWKDDFYAGVPRSRWLEHYAQHFNAVEVNATFYHTLRTSTLERWRDLTPPHFRFCIKASRYITHIQRLETTDESLARLRAQADALGAKLAVVLWQMPQGLKRDLDLFERFARRLDGWRGVRHAIEFRNESWFGDEVAQRLSEQRLAAVQSHAADWPMWEAVTTDLVYVRLHGGAHTYASAYSTAALRRWAERIQGWLAQRREVHVYFDNTAEGHAVQNALALAKLCQGKQSG
jgi:uncharacterized protein YecE (DUF72 family)